MRFPQFSVGRVSPAKAPRSSSRAAAPAAGARRGQFSPPSRLPTQARRRSPCRPSPRLQRLTPRPVRWRRPCPQRPLSLSASQSTALRCLLRSARRQGSACRSACWSRCREQTARSRFAVLSADQSRNLSPRWRSPPRVLQQLRCSLEHWARDRSSTQAQAAPESSRLAGLGF